MSSNSTATQYRWIITDGDSGDVVYVSYDKEPIFRLEIGIYDVELTITETNSHTKVKKSQYILVMRPNNTIITDQYLSNPRCYSYGFKESPFGGWSENRGDHWIRPSTTSSIITTQIQGKETVLCWDMYDEYQYIIGGEDSVPLGFPYLDKGKYPIETEYITSSITAGFESAMLTHEQTTLDVSIKEDAASDEEKNVLFDVCLYIDSNGTDEVEKVTNVNTDTEIVFKHQNSKIKNQKSRRIGVKTNSSAFTLDKIETYFRYKDIFKRAAKEHFEDYDWINGDLNIWLSFSDYTRNRATGQLIRLAAPSGPVFQPKQLSYIKGPNNGLKSAIMTTSELPVYNNSIADGTILLWCYGSSTPYIGGLSFTKFGDEVNGWSLYYHTGNVPENIVIPISSKVFDFRIYNNNITTDGNHEYILQYYIDNMNSFLPQEV